jgi:hypothetical protein
MNQRHTAQDGKGLDHTHVEQVDQNHALTNHILDRLERRVLKKLEQTDQGHEVACQFLNIRSWKDLNLTLQVPNRLEVLMLTYPHQSNITRALTGHHHTAPSQKYQNLLLDNQVLENLWSLILEHTKGDQDLELEGWVHTELDQDQVSRDLALIYQGQGGQGLEVTDQVLENPDQRNQDLTEIGLVQAGLDTVDLALGNWETKNQDQEVGGQVLGDQKQGDQDQELEGLIHTESILTNHGQRLEKREDHHLRMEGDHQLRHV